MQNSRQSTPLRLDEGTRQAIQDVHPQKSFVVYPGTQRFTMQEQVEAIELIEMMAELQTFEES